MKKHEEHHMKLEVEDPPMLEGAVEVPCKSVGDVYNKRWDEKRLNDGARSAGSRRDRPKKPSPYTTKEYELTHEPTDDQLQETQEIIRASIAHFNGNKEAASRALELDMGILERIQNGKKIAFTDVAFKAVSKLYVSRVAASDPLTGKLNRTAIGNRVEKFILKEQAFSLMFIDLDQFKPVNDTYGHRVGDKLLQSVAQRVWEVVPEDAHVGRLGGDEFCVLVPHTHGEGAIKRYTRQIEQELKMPFYFDELEGGVYISGSVGVAHYPQEADTFARLLHIADQKMYSSKPKVARLTEELGIHIGENILYYATIFVGLLLSVSWIIGSFYMKGLMG